MLGNFGFTSLPSTEVRKSHLVMNLIKILITSFDRPVTNAVGFKFHFPYNKKKFKRTNISGNSMG